MPCTKHKYCQYSDSERVTWLYPNVVIGSNSNFLNYFVHQILLAFELFVLFILFGFTVFVILKIAVIAIITTTAAQTRMLLLGGLFLSLLVIILLLIWHAAMPKACITSWEGPLLKVWVSFGMFLPKGYSIHKRRFSLTPHLQSLGAKVWVLSSSHHIQPGCCFF